MWIALACLAGGLSEVVGEEQAVPVEVAIAQRSEGLTRKVMLTGTVTSQQHARLSARTSGLVEAVQVDAGSKVKKGEVLLELDARFAEIDLDLVRAEIDSAQAQLDEANRKVEEVRGLLEVDAFPKTQAEELKANLRIRGAELKGLKVREEQQRERIERHRLVAPFSGVISRKNTEAGEWVDTGTVVLELIDTKELWFDLQVPQEHLTAVEDAQTITVYLDAHPDQPLDAEIDIAVPVKDPISRTFLTRLTLQDPEKHAMPGMSGTVHIASQPTDATVRIPRDAVVRLPGGEAKVWIVEANGEGAMVARSQTVEITQALGESTEVRKGLKGSEKVVIRGNEGLEDGQVVELQNPSGGEDS